MLGRRGAYTLTHSQDAFSEGRADEALRLAAGEPPRPGTHIMVCSERQTHLSAGQEVKQSDPETPLSFADGPLLGLSRKTQGTERPRRRSARLSTRRGQRLKQQERPEEDLELESTRGDDPAGGPRRAAGRRHRAAGRAPAAPLVQRRQGQRPARTSLWMATKKTGSRPNGSNGDRTLIVGSEQTKSASQNS